MSHIELVRKFQTAITTLKSGTEYVITHKAPETEEEFNSNVEWVIGKTETNTGILTKTNPHSELTWPAIKAEMDKL